MTWHLATSFNFVAKKNCNRIIYSVSLITVGIVMKKCLPEMICEYGIWVSESNEISGFMLNQESERIFCEIIVNIDKREKNGPIVCMKTFRTKSHIESSTNKIQSKEKNWLIERTNTKNFYNNSINMLSPLVRTRVGCELKNHANFFKSHIFINEIERTVNK